MTGPYIICGFSPVHWFKGVFYMPNEAWVWLVVWILLAFSLGSAFLLRVIRRFDDITGRM